MKTHQWVNIRFSQTIVRSVKAETYEQAVVKVKNEAPSKRLGHGPISAKWEYAPMTTEGSETIEWHI